MKKKIDFFIFFTVFVGVITIAHAQSYLNPQSYTSLGTFNSTANITVNMSTNQMSGGASFTGIVSNNILIFTFDSFTLNSGHTISFTNVTNLGNKVAFLSRGSMSIAGTINASASQATSGPGGGFGASTKGNSGSGSGGGTGNTNGGAGGGFGGTGGNAGYGAAGGSNYGDLSSSLAGGSGGGAPLYITITSFTYGGGGGGGALLLGASGTLTLTSTALVKATGAIGNADAGNNDGSGGGSGGGILLQAHDLVLNSGATIDVSGGNGGTSTGGTLGGGGGGGSGGRIHCAYHTSGSISNSATFVVTGGAGGNGGSVAYNGIAGSAGNTTIVQSSNSALPIELASFTATAVNSSATLAWYTTTEVNNYGFEVERRNVSETMNSGVIEWLKIGFIHGAGTSNAQKEYSYTDASVSSGKYTYRLKQIDNDGTYKYSSETEVTIAIPKVFTLNQNYPNPFNPTTTINFTLAQDGYTTLKIYNVLGKEVATMVNGEMKAGIQNTVTFDASRLASGVYFSCLTSGGKSMIKKVVLMK